MEEKSYNQELLVKEKDTLLRKLNEKQRQIFDLIINACTNNRQELIFVYGHGGTDRTLRDILSKLDALFGGKTVMLGGDFRQTLPVKGGASRNEIVASSIAKSYLWHHFTLHNLTENMRLTDENMDETQTERVSTFAKWLLDIGDGSIGIPDEY
ncbi:DNA helicase, partial [Tanacetum coccineum]